jgi:hypothetical protein
MSSPDFPTIVSILEKWSQIQKDIWCFDYEKSPHYYNVKRVLGLYRSLAELLKKEEPVLRAWTNAYLETYRRDVFVRWWGRHVLEWAKDRLDSRFNNKELHPDAEHTWDSVFGSSAQTRFSLAHTVVENAVAKLPLDKCDDLTILAIHEGKQCDDGMYCFLCEDIKRRVFHSRHPLLNSDMQTYFSNRIKAFPENWTPPHVWGTIYGRGSSHECFDRDTYVDYMKKRRAEEYGKDGLTPIQATKSLISMANHTGKWNHHLGMEYLKQRFENEKDRQFEVFYTLWNTLDLLQISIDLDLQRIDEIDDMFIVTVEKMQVRPAVALNA